MSDLLNEWKNDPKVDPIAKALMSIKIPEDYFLLHPFHMVPKKKYAMIPYKTHEGKNPPNKI